MAYEPSSKEYLKTLKLVMAVFGLRTLPASISNVDFISLLNDAYHEHYESWRNIFNQSAVSMVHRDMEAVLSREFFCFVEFLHFVGKEKAMIAEYGPVLVKSSVPRVPMNLYVALIQARLLDLSTDLGDMLQRSGLLSLADTKRKFPTVVKQNPHYKIVEGETEWSIEGCVVLMPKRGMPLDTLLNEWMRQQPFVVNTLRLKKNQSAPSVHALRKGKLEKFTSFDSRGKRYKTTIYLARSAEKSLVLRYTVNVPDVFNMENRGKIRAIIARLWKFQFQKL